MLQYRANLKQHRQEANALNCIGNVEHLQKKIAQNM